MGIRACVFAFGLSSGLLFAVGPPPLHSSPSEIDSSDRAEERTDFISGVESRLRDGVSLKDCFLPESVEGGGSINLMLALHDVAGVVKKELSAGKYDREAATFLQLKNKRPLGDEDRRRLAALEARRNRFFSEQLKLLEGKLNHLAYYPRRISREEEARGILRNKVSREIRAEIGAQLEWARDKKDSLAQKALGNIKVGCEAGEAGDRKSSIRDCVEDFETFVVTLQNELRKSWREVPVIKVKQEELYSKVQKVFDELQSLLVDLNATEDPEEKERIQSAIDKTEAERESLGNRYADLSRAYGAQASDSAEVKEARSNLSAQKWIKENAAKTASLAKLEKSVASLTAKADEFFERNQADVSLYDSYFLSRHAAKVPHVFSVLVTTDPETGQPVIDSLAIVEGKPLDGKKGNVSVVFEPDAKKIVRNKGTDVMLKGAAASLKDPEISKTRTVHCRVPLLKESDEER